MKAMIFAAGLGTRLKPITDSLPKALVPVKGKPLLEYVILKLKSAGFDEIIVNIHHFPDLIIDFLRSKNDFGIRIEISDERDLLLDTGGGIRKAAHFFDDGKPFLIHNVDILSNVDLQDIYKHHLEESDRLASLAVSYRDTYRYLLFDDKNRLHGWINTKTGETKPEQNMNESLFHRFAYAGIQVVSPKIFELMENEEEKFPIMDFYLRICRDEKIIGYIPENIQMLDVGKLNTLDSAVEFVNNYHIQSY